MLMLSVLVCILWTNYSHSANILAFMTTPAMSHFMATDTLLQALAHRGHNITFVSTFGTKHKDNLYNHVHLPDVWDAHIGILKKYDHNGFPKIPHLLRTTLMLDDFVPPLESLLAHEKFQMILHGNQSWDLLIIEYFCNPMLYGLGAHFKAPTVALLNYAYDIIANEMMISPVPESFTPDVHLLYGSRMDFFERLFNFLHVNLTKLYFHLVVINRHNEILHKYLPNLPHLQHSFFNTSLMLTNNHLSYKYPTPNLPNIIDIGGIHIKNSTLPENLKKFLDDSKEGFIYFSMGSFINDDASECIFDVIINTLSKTNMKVLYKLPGEERVTDKFMFRNWVPQQAVLAHPNIKLFITHGGIHSIMETVYYAVPIVGIPVLFDQEHNIQVCVQNGIGLSLNFHELQEDKLYSIIMNVLECPKYGIAVSKRSKAFKDRPMSPMDTAVYWAEYAIRHKGAQFLRSPGYELTWYQHRSLDVIIIILLSCCMLSWLVKLCFQRRSRQKNKQD